jgi:hypothetical protein
MSIRFGGSALLAGESDVAARGRERQDQGRSEAVHAGEASISSAVRTVCGPHTLRAAAHQSSSDLVARIL